MNDQARRFSRGFAVVSLAVGAVAMSANGVAAQESGTMRTGQAGRAGEAGQAAQGQGQAGQPGTPAQTKARVFDLAVPTVEFGGATVMNAPYSADISNESTQTLADGNRIVRKETSSVARDSQGRTRREMSLTAIGSWMPEEAPKWVVIQDPVAGFVYTLDDQRKTAMRHRLPSAADMAMVGDKAGHEEFFYASQAVMAMPPPGAAGAGVAMRVDAETVAADGDDGGPRTAVAGVTMAMAGPALHLTKDEGQTESLGKRMIDGVEAVGTRTTQIIPAGEIGNEQPIRIVSESWYSRELQTLVYSKRDDPRMGEMVYRLANIVRAEPAPQLFEVPAGYTVTDLEKEFRRTKALQDRRP